MGGARPRDVVEYCKWLKDARGVEVDDRVRNHYRAVLAAVREGFRGSGFWRDVVGGLREIDAKYMLETGYSLLMKTDAPELVEKPFDSFFDKTFRKNVVDNRTWPEAPPGGWVLPDGWYGRVGDTVRTCFVVKYLDGVEFLARWLSELCAEHGLRCHEHFEAREEGYYAAHVYVAVNYEIPSRVDWDTERMMIEVELQITTQVQEVIRRLLHKYYEEQRSKGRRRSEKWQWDYASDRFVAGYMGHILHYVEGMIMEVRDRQREEEDGRAV